QAPRQAAGPRNARGGTEAASDRITLHGTHLHIHPIREFRLPARTAGSILVHALVGRHQDVAIAVGLLGGYQPGPFHLLEDAGRPVVADPQVALHEGNRGPAAAHHDFDSLIVQRIAFRVGEARDGTDAVAGFALDGAFEQAFDVVRLAFGPEGLDHAVDLVVMHESAMHPR